MENYTAGKRFSFKSKFQSGLFGLPWNSRTISAASITVVGAALVFAVGTAFMSAATVAYGCLVLGLLWRPRPDWRVQGLAHAHTLAMLTGMAIDLTIVLILEWSRNAIDTALSFRLGPAQQAHIGFSTTALILYFPTVLLGWRLWKGRPSATLRRWHLRFAVSAFVFRSLGFLMMLSFLGRK